MLAVGVGRVSWAAGALEPEFDQKCGETEEDVWEEFSGEDEGAQEQVEDVYSEGEEMGPVEGCCVAGCECFLGFLRDWLE